MMRRGRIESDGIQSPSREIIAMEPVVRKLIIQGFRSFRSEVVEFDNPTFLVGCNGSGKSNLLDALVFLSQAMTNPLTELFSWRGGGRVVCHGSSTLLNEDEHRNLGLGVVLGSIGREISHARYAFQIAATGARRPTYVVHREQCIVDRYDGRREYFERKENEAFRSSIAGFEPQLEEDALAIRLIGGDIRFAPVYHVLESIQDYSIRPGTMRLRQDSDSSRVLFSNGSNTASILQEIAENNADDLLRICEFMEAIVPTVKQVEVREYGGMLELEFTQRWDDGPKSLTLEAMAMSDGTLQALGLLTAVYQKRLPSLMAIEEPETSIHPGALGVILDVLSFASERTQLIVTTHSPEVLDAEWLEDRHIRIVTWENGESRVMPLSIGSREALREHLMSAGELFRSNALQGMPSGQYGSQEAELFEDLEA
jgi:predicted ATPase